MNVRAHSYAHADANVNGDGHAQLHAHAPVHGQVQGCMSPVMSFKGVQPRMLDAHEEAQEHEHEHEYEQEHGRAHVTEHVCTFESACGVFLGRCRVRQQAIPRGMCMCMYIGEGTWTSGVRLGVCVRVYDSDTEDAHEDIRAYAPMDACTHALCVGAACFAAWA